MEIHAVWADAGNGSTVQGELWIVYSIEGVQGSSMKPTPPLEREEQATFVEYALTRYPTILLFSVPNEAKRGYWLARLMKKMGLRPGYPDIGIDEPRGGYHGLRIEMKRVGGRKPTAAQLEVMSALSERGYFVRVCYGAESAIKTLDWYWGLE